MGIRHIDKYFKDNLKGYSKEVDTDAVWAALDLDNNDKKKKPGFFWLIGLSLLTCMGVIYFATDSLNTQYDEQLVPQEKNDTKINSTSVKKDIIAASIKNSDKPIKINPTLNQVQKSVIDKSFKDTSIRNTKNTRSITSTKTKTQFVAPTKLQSSNSLRPIYNTLVVDGQQAETVKQEVDIDFNSSDLNEQIEIAFNHSVDFLATNKLAFSQALRALDINEDESLPILNISNQGGESEEINKNKKKRGGLSVSVYSGLYQLDKSFNTDGQKSEFLAEKEYALTPLELSSVGTQLKYDFGGIYVKAGVEFQSLNERFEFEQYTVLDTVNVPGVVGILIDRNGDASDQQGFVQEVNTSTKRWLNHNNYRLFSIPLSIGYEKKINKWSLSVEAQSIFNFHRSFSGLELDSEFMVTDKSNTINDSFNLGFGISIGLGYTLTDKTSVYLRPHYFRYSDSFDIEGQNYTQKYDVYGLQVGLNYRL